MDELFPNLPDELRPTLESIKAENDDVAIHPYLTTTQEWQGYRFPAEFCADTAKVCYEDYDFEENSILVASFPKTGTTWTMEIVRQLLYGANERLDKLTKNLTHPIIYLEFWTPDKWKLMKYLDLPRKYFGTHMPSYLINLEKLKKSNSKIIVPIRNPKDQAVSWYHFTQNPSFDLLRQYYVSDWDKFLTDFMEGKQPMEVTRPGESYAEFLLSWYKHRNDDNILFVCFENLKKNPDKEIRRIAEFLNIDVNDTVVSKIVKKSSFESMKKNQEHGDSAMAQTFKKVEMMRTGKVGSWKEKFTVAQSEKMDELMNRKLSGTDIKFIYE